MAARISPLYFNINPVDPDSHQQQGVKSYIYIKPADQADQKPSSLVLINHTGRYPIQLKGNHDQVSYDNYHFYLEFDDGLLDDPASIQVQTEGWSVYYDDEDDNFTTLYFLSNQDLSLSTAQNQTLTLQHFFASQSEGPGTTTVTLSWNDDPDYVEIVGSHERYDNEDDHTSINVVNITHQNSAPLYVNFESTNVVLNDGQTKNDLTLRITNVSDKSLALATPGSNPATFTINFDYDPNGNHQNKWALLEPSTVDAVSMNVSYKGQSWGEAQRQTEGNQYTWTFSAPSDPSLSLDPYSSIEVTITGIKTAYATGQSNLYLHTSNTPSHWDGYYTAVIEKSPLIYSGAQVGIGTNTPQAKLDITGIALSKMVDVDCEHSQDTWGGVHGVWTWQSFTPSISGQIESIAIYGHLAFVLNFSVKLYEGEDTAGTCLINQTFANDSPNKAIWRTFDFSSSALLEAGQKYTFSIEADGDYRWRYAQKNYSGGKSSAPEGRDLAFKTYMRVQQPTLNLNGLAIHSTQNKLGIGTNTPQAMLDVQGDVAISGQLTVGLLSQLTVNGDTTLSGKLTVNDNTTLSGSLTVNDNTTLSGSLTVNSSTSLKQLTVDGNTTLSGDLTIDSRNSNKRLIIDWGDQRNSGTDFPLEVRASGYGIYQTCKDVEVGIYINADSSAGYLGTRSDHSLRFFTDDSGPQMTLHTSGNLGIGTTDPQAKLDVRGNISASGSLTVGNVTLTEENLKFLKGLADGSAVVNLITQKNYIIDNYYTRANDGDDDRTIQFLSGHADSWQDKAWGSFKLLIAVDGQANRKSYD